MHVNKIRKKREDQTSGFVKIIELPLGGKTQSFMYVDESGFKTLRKISEDCLTK